MGKKSKLTYAEGDEADAEGEGVVGRLELWRAGAKNDADNLRLPSTGAVRGMVFEVNARGTGGTAFNGGKLEIGTFDDTSEAEEEGREEKAAAAATLALRTAVATGKRFKDAAGERDEAPAGERTGGETE